MATIDLDYKRLKADPKKYGKGYSLNSLTYKEFEKFNPSVLGLGDLSKSSKSIDALVAFMDLQGFTDFCNQVDSHLVIPEFLTKYLEWLFKSIVNISKEGEYKTHVKIWGSLPFYSKFLGDGILFIWKTENSGGVNGLFNISRHLLKITNLYKSEFLPTIKHSVVKPPIILRCGIARGQIITVGDGNDFVGSCINIAARIQKVSLLSFAISRRGFDLDTVKESEFYTLLTLKKYPIRGIGSEELIYVRKDEFKKLPPIEKEQFQNTK
jgi:hypothetical protein